MSSSKKVFTYEEALALIPEVQRLTSEAVARLESVLDADAPAEEEDEVSDEYQQVVAEWAGSMIDLGAEVKGLWLVDFDSGGGYYCWRYPEPALEYFHEYEVGFNGRIKLN